MRVGNNDDFHRAIAARENFVRALDELLRQLGFIDRAHVAKAKMSVHRHAVAHPRAEQPPHWNREQLAQDIPKCDFDSRDGAHADDAKAPEAVLLHDPDELLDVARIASDHERSEISPRDRARLPLERRLAPSAQAILIGLDAHEDPVAHLRMHDDGANVGDLQSETLPAAAPPLLALRPHTSPRQDPYPYRRACCSAIITAAINNTPFATIWKNVGTLVRIKPLSSTPMMRTPSKPPMIVPLPPVSAHPPRTAAVMAFSSSPSDPEIGCPNPGGEQHSG